MTWLNPAAFLGLLALAVPIFVHLFGRRIAKRQRFPSLRLLMDSRATPATRSRPSDLLLLVIRCGIVLAAVLALAQPRWSSAARMREASIPARVILVDTSGSMRRTSDGSALRDLAQLTAQRLLDSAREGMIVETQSPGANVAGAASWLSRRAGLREVVILSDFQVGALSDGDLAAVPEGLGVSLRRVGASPNDSEPAIGVDSDTAVSARADAAVTHGTWSLAATDSILPFTVMTASADTAEAHTMIAAVRGLVPNLGASANRVVISFPGSALLPGTSNLLVSRWQGDLLLSLRGNRLLADAMHSADVEPSCLAGGAVVAHQGFGFHAATVAAADSGLVVQSCARAGSVAGTALLAAVATALTPVPAFMEREPSVLPDETLRTWERLPTEMARRGTEETSPDGRWFWLLAIVLLPVEQIMRRGKQARSATRVSEARRERVA